MAATNSSQNDVHEKLMPLVMMLNTIRFMDSRYFKEKRTLYQPVIFLSIDKFIKYV